MLIKARESFSFSFLRAKVPRAGKRQVENRGNPRILAFDRRSKLKAMPVESVNDLQLNLHARLDR